MGTKKVVAKSPKQGEAKSSGGRVRSATAGNVYVFNSRCAPKNNNLLKEIL
jgi:hypothetical protein